MYRAIRDAFFGLAGVLFLVLPAAGQVQWGDLSANLSGVISAGYTADYGNEIQSSHGLDLGGTAALSGYYYNPNFISFNFSPYYGQSRANSTFQTISDSSGFTISSSIFGGSHFPGSINYSKAYNSEGEYAVPGLPNFTTHGDSDTFGIAWSAILPNLPSLSVSYQMGSNQYSVYGANETGNSEFKNFNLHSGYSIAGFNLGASYQIGASNSFVPPIFQGGQMETITTDNSGFGANVSHSLPLRGNFFASFYRSDIDTDYLGYKYQGDFDVATTGASFQPTNKLAVSVTANYSDNLAGILFQNAPPSGGGVLPENNLTSSHAWSVFGNASYAVSPDLQLQASADRREQSYLGENFGADSYGAGILYTHGLLGGTLNTAFNVIDSTVSNSSQNSLGFSTNVNYNRRVGNWYVGSSFSYAQNVQSVLVTYTTSFYSYSGNVRRRWGKFNWNAGAGFGHSGLTNQPGTNSSSQSYNTSIGYGRWINLAGTYGTSNGIGVVSAGGIVPVTLSPLVPTNLITLYGGTGYGFSVGSTPARRLTLSASYSRASSNTTNAGVSSSNHLEQKNALVQYQFRKMYLTAGYAQLSQGFSASGIAPANVSSYFFGVTRWFNFF